MKIIITAKCPNPAISKLTELAAGLPVSVRIRSSGATIEVDGSILPQDEPLSELRERIRRVEKELEKELEALASPIHRVAAEVFAREDFERLAELHSQLEAFACEADMAAVLLTAYFQTEVPECEFDYKLVLWEEEKEGLREGAGKGSEELRHPPRTFPLFQFFA